MSNVIELANDARQNRHDSMLKFLRMAIPNGRIVLPIGLGYEMPPDLQDAFDEALAEDLVKFVDIRPDPAKGALVRVYMITPAGVKYREYLAFNKRNGL